MMLPGYFLMRTKFINTKTLIDFSQVIIKVFYPCLIFSSITKNYTWSQIIKSWQLPVAVFIILIIGYIIGLIYTGFFKEIDTEKKKSMLFQFTVNNYSFLPLAIIAKLYDEQHMAALILSTLGAELTVWTLGMHILNKGEKAFSIKNIKHLLSPPLISIYISLSILILFNISNTTFESLSNSNISFQYIRKTIYDLGLATIPLSMIMIGGRIGTIKFSDLFSIDIWILTAFRLLIIPMFAIGIIKYLFGHHPYINILLIVAIMPLSNASMVLTEIYGGDQKMISGSVLVSHIVALVSIPLWLHFLL